ncbi:hypothetical protein O0I10_009364 [Lichtheimia ornata]|uniref:Ion transport domain-containing protein n=1 Tax=Lichtheimia ornata TaxID=688661 RepID=A0AAD7XVW4_9FUNG|nr:uncharacterized protein O0I10_009364 [Lichtheimia ornata]KAJ8654968.1 hypothetical protein O0I10_009364 [Lichtheimia ornata]
MNDDDTDALLTERSARTQHGLTRSEMIQGMANRFMYSQFYIILYLCLAILSLVSIILSLRDTCPTLMFIVFESVINFAMIIEVGIRLLALRRAYWNSVWNIIDTILVTLCAITLIVIASGCSAGERSEAIFDTVLLVIRNCIQFFRLFMIVRKNKHSMTARSARVDFDDVREPSVEFSALERGLDESFLSSEESDEDNHRV